MSHFRYGLQFTILISASGVEQILYGYLQSESYAIEFNERYLHEVTTFDQVKSGSGDAWTESGYVS
jgi:hypothetical protein